MYPTRTTLAIPLLLLSTSIMASEGISCQLTLLKAISTQGDRVEICRLTNGQFRYEQVDKGTATPRYRVEVDANKTAILFQETEDSVGKQVALYQGDKTYYIETLTRDKVTTADAIVEHNGKTLSELTLDSRTLEDNITQTLIESRPKPPDIKKH